MSDDFEVRMRDMMRAQSEHAPDDYPVVQHVLRQVADRPAIAQQSRWRAWLVPLVAAGAVAAVAATIVGVQNFRPSAHDQAGVVPTESSAPQPAPTTAPTTSPTTQQSQSAPPAAAQDPALKGFRITDLTFVGESAWALATTVCMNPSGCPQVVARSEGGGPWHAANVPSMAWADKRIEHIRFATEKVGYAYGAGFFMTVDGGQTWKSEGDGLQTLALETLDGNVIRVQTKCLPGCPPMVTTAPIGGQQWTQRGLDGDFSSMQSGATLIRVAGTAYLAIYGHTAGGGSDATSRLFVSTDDGEHWVNKGEPCPQTGGGYAGSEVDTTAIASGGGALAVLCTPRGVSTSSLLVSTDRGASFVRGSTTVEAGNGPVAVSGPVVLVDASGVLTRSTDGGNSWHVVPSVGAVSWLGFESDRDARAVSGDGRTIWTTHDAGATWAATAFP